MKNTVNEINAAIRSDVLGFIDRCEDRYTGDVNAIAEYIAEDDDIIIISVAGPSSSGKTTTAELLRNRLERLDEKTEVMSLDNFYLTGDKLPLLPDGSRDLESVNALDLDLIKECFNEIITLGRTEVPVYDFKTRSRIKSEKIIDIGKHGIVIVEGLHALNPLITGLIPKKNIRGIYVSVNDPVYDENGEILIDSWDIRLIRRVLRDEQFRNSDVNETLDIWDKVIAGEFKYLYQCKAIADFKLATLHPYELGLYKERMGELKSLVTNSTEHYEHFAKLADAVSRFDTVDRGLVPKRSLLREFIG